MSDDSYNWIGSTEPDAISQTQVTNYINKEDVGSIIHFDGA